MKPDDIDDILARAAHSSLPSDAERAAVERARNILLDHLRPVRPMAPVWMFTFGLVTLFAGFSTASAALLGLHGLRVLNPIQAASIFSILLLTAWLAAAGCARTMRPAAGLRIGWLAWALAVLVFPALFSLVFHGYSTRNFIHEGIPCLVAGLSVAIPTGLAVALILRRGFVMEWSSAGVAAGALSGLTGLAMLELHCPNLKAIHVMFWHVAVVMAAGLLGWAIGSLADFFRRRGSKSKGAAPGSA
jgi:hypothetical protein